MAEPETSRDEGNDEAALVLAAAGGDRRAAGEYFARHLQRLSSIARHVAGTSHDPDDLLSDALVTVLSRWASGTGPTEYVTAYIVQIMRNRMKDDFKSPRWNVRHLDQAEEPVDREDPRIRQIEIAPELALIRRAMAELPEDQQLILTATIVEGVKPGELRDRLARPMTAIYSLSHRARANLRRTTLRLILEENARPECYAAAQHLPEHVENSPDNIRGSRFTEHYKTCRRCRRSWARFGALATLGLASLLVIGDLAFGAPPAAQASESEPDAPARVAAGSSDAGPVRLSPPSPARGVAAASRIAAPAAAAASTLGAVILAVLAVALITQTFWFTPNPTASLTVRADTADVSSTWLDIDFDVHGESWTIRTARLVLSDQVAVKDEPEGWSCESTGYVVTCSTALIDADGGVIKLAHSPSIPRLKYDLELVAVTDDGLTVVGTYGDTVVR